MSGDIFKKAFSKSVEEERQRKLESERDTEIQRERIEEIRESVESVISEIPSVFKVSNVRFDDSVRFKVNIPSGPESYLNVSVGWSVKERDDLDVWSKTEERYFAHIHQNGDILSRNPHNPKNDDYYSGYVFREGVGRWLASELGRILGEEYEQARGFYKSLEEGR